MFTDWVFRLTVGGMNSAVVLIYRCLLCGRQKRRNDKVAVHPIYTIYSRGKGKYKLWPQDEVSHSRLRNVDRDDEDKLSLRINKDFTFMACGSCSSYPCYCQDKGKKAECCQN